MNFNDADSGRLLNRDHFTARHLRTINADVEWFACGLLQFDHGTGAKLHQVANTKPQPSNLNGNMQRNIEYRHQFSQHRVRAECQRNGRGSVEVIVQSGRAYQLSPEMHALHQELGVDHVILDTQVSSNDQSEFIEAMHHWAEITGLRARLHA